MMKNKYWNIVKRTAQMTLVVAFFMLFINATNIKQSPKTEANIRDTATVSMALDKFSPDTIIVQINTIVIWTNKDLWAHTVTSNMGLFDSKKLGHQEKFTHKFTQVGVYNYHCDMHKHMKATVIVK